MWLHCQDWEAASRVAEQHDPPSLTDVLLAQAQAAAAQQQYQLAESVLLRARRPDLALKMYRCMPLM
jgi:intraflagellar transport protein 172